MNICLFTKEEINQPLQLLDERANHIIKILHKKVGDSFTAGIINGQSGKATISSITNEQIEFNFIPSSQEEEKPLNPLIMIIGFPRPIQLKRLLRDIAALGVKEVHLTQTQLTEKSYLKSSLLENNGAEQMLLDGTVQAGSTFVPNVEFHKSVKDCIDFLEKKYKNQIQKRLALDNVDASCSLSVALKNLEYTKNTENFIIAAIGSERGWTTQERVLLEQNDYVRCSMGKRIMRTETASTVAGAIILEKMGFLS